MTQWVYTNNAKSALDSSISNSALSITVGAGEGALFPAPTGSEAAKLTIEDRRTGLHEILNLTARTADVLTVTRGEEGTSARSWAAGSIISCRMTAEVFNDVYGGVYQNGIEIAALDARVDALAAEDYVTAALEVIFPVNSLYASASAVMPAAISALGTWVPYAAGRALVGVGTADGVTWALGVEKGSAAYTVSEHSHGASTIVVDAVGDHTHSGTTLNTSSAGSHSHTYSRENKNTFFVDTGSGTIHHDGQTKNTSSAGNHSHNITGNVGSSGAHTHILSGETDTAGTADAENNIQPSVGTSIWKRIA
eukprot:GHVR01074350.1.p1 GENE.GHVR01074350.1~~GHVR01074350.1.p1  ORF type:complete len:309 (-),score=43.08 GHVR01074350.1:481-1407(-)